MVVFRVIIGTIWVSILVLGRAIWLANAPEPPSVSSHATRAALIGETDAPATAGGTSAPRLDLYGNPIERAVGDYRTDRRGDLYERHAPDTAILDPGPPSL